MAKITELKEEDPEAVKRRVKALKKIQAESAKVEADFHKELQNGFLQLREKYAKKSQPLADLRAKIVNGQYEPTDKECDFKDDSGVQTEDAWKNYKNFIKELDYENGIQEPDKVTKGIPGFWLNAFKNDRMINEIIEETDHVLLKKLLDVTISEIPKGFKLNFFFAPNDFIHDAVLTKEFELEYEPKKDAPFLVGNSKISKSKGCPINWKSGRNITMKTIKDKAPWNKGKGKKKGKAKSTVTKTVPREKSFFYFFNDQFSSDSSLTEAFVNEVGLRLRNRVIPRAIYYYTGQAPFEKETKDEFKKPGSKKEAPKNSGGWFPRYSMQEESSDDEEESDSDSEDDESSFVEICLHDFLLGAMFGSRRGLLGFGGFGPAPPRSGYSRRGRPYQNRY